MILSTYNTIQSIFCCCCSVQKSTRQVRTQINLNNDGNSSEEYKWYSKPLPYVSTHKNRSNREHVQLSKRRPLPPLPQGESHGEKIRVIALYDFLPRESCNLALKRAEEYLVLEKYNPHWWRARDQSGKEGLIPSNYVTEYKLTNLEIYEILSLGVAGSVHYCFIGTDLVHLIAEDGQVHQNWSSYSIVVVSPARFTQHQFVWYHKNVTRNQAEDLLRQESKEGAFIVRDSRRLGAYTISVYSRNRRSDVVPIKHYQIKNHVSGQCYVTERHLFSSIPELIQYHQHNAAGLITRLRYPVGPMGNCLPATAGFSYEKWKIDQSELTFIKEVGKGQFGVVHLGKWKSQVLVAIKAINEGAMSEDDFIEEAKVMMKLSHPRLVQLYGVCIQQKPLYIVTEFMENGCLLHYLRQRQGRLRRGVLLSICQDVCEGMEYLERNNFIHRDLAARNCLVSATFIVKISDFGMTRYVLNDEYISSSGAKFPVKWSAPEVFHFNKYSSKSDVWSFGILMWEVFTEGKMPFAKESNLQVIEAISKGFRLYRPLLAPMIVYEVMYSCWHEKPEGRPTFAELTQTLTDIAETG